MRVVILLAVLSTMLCGCAGPPAAHCNGTTCQPSASSASPSTTTPTVPPSPIINVTLPFFAFDDCNGISFGIEKPVDLVDPFVPDDFGPASSVPFLAQIGIDAHYCPKVAYGNRTFEGVGTLWSYVNVVPKDSSWGKNGDSYYTLDVLVTNQTLAALLTSVSVPATVATLQRTSTPIQGGAVGETWEFSGPNSGFKFAYEHGVDTQGSARKFDRFHWIGERPYTRIDIHHQDKLFQPGTHGGTLELTGDSKFEQVLGSDRTAFHAAALQFLEWTLQPYNQTFGR